MSDTARTNKRAALTVAVLSSFIGPFMSSAVNVALPSIGQEYSMGVVLLGWINTAFLLAAAAFLVPFGRLGDIYGRKKLFVSGVLTLVLSSILIAVTRGSTAIIIGRVVQGFGSSMVFATAVPILTSVFPAGERGGALGTATAAVYFGLSAGPFFGGFITQQLGWRYIFWLNVPLGLILFAVAFFLLKGDWAEAREERFDLIGSSLLGVTLLATMYGFSSLPSYGGGALIAAGLVGLAGFVRYEQRVAHPVVQIDLFRKNTVFAFSTLAALINYAATFAVSFLLSIYLQKVRGLSPQAAGLLMVSQPITMAVFSPFTGRLSDKIEPRTLASLGMALTFVGLAMLTPLDMNTSTAYLIVCLVVLGIGFGLFSSPNTNAVMSSVSQRSFGVAGAILSAMRQSGMMLSMGIVMMLTALFVGRGEIVPEGYDHFLLSMRTAFGLFAALSIVGIFASLARGKVNRAAS